MPRDMSKNQFDEACKRNGFVPQGFLGYYDLGIPGHNLNVSAHNAGDNRRARLAYLLHEKERWVKKFAEAEKK